MAISFSGATKAELCRCFPQRHCCALAQCFGILLFCNSFSADGIRIVTESKEFAAMLPKLFRKAFSLNFDAVPDHTGSGKQVFTVTDPEKIHTIMTAYGFHPKDTVSVHVNLSVVEEECCRASFLQAAVIRLSQWDLADDEKKYLTSGAAGGILHFAAGVRKDCGGLTGCGAVW